MLTYSDHPGPTTAMITTDDQGGRTSKVLIERTAQLVRRTEVSNADAWSLTSQRGLHPEIRDLAKLRVQEAAESPLRFASACFPMLPR